MIYLACLHSFNRNHHCQEFLLQCNLEIKGGKTEDTWFYALPKINLINILVLKSFKFEYFALPISISVKWIDPVYPLFLLCFQRAPLSVDGSYQSLEALPIEHLQIVFVGSSSCSEEDTTTTTTSSSTTAVNAPTCQQRPAAKKNSSLANGYTSFTPTKVQDFKAKAKKPTSKVATTKRLTGKDRERAKKGEIGKKTGVEEEALDAPPDGWPLRRVISIEEDHLPHLLQGGPQPLLHQLSEEEDEEDAEEEEAQSDTESSIVTAPDLSAPLPSSHLPVSAKAPPARKSRFTRAKKMPTSSRGQPVGKESQQVCAHLWSFKAKQKCLDLGVPNGSSFTECDVKKNVALSLCLSASEDKRRSTVCSRPPV